MNPFRKVFKLDEANALLPELEEILSQFETRHDTFRRLEDELFFEEMMEGASPAESRLKALEDALLSLEEHIRKIRSLGCLLRHAEKGLVDFPARQDEKWIYYCWRKGEKEIQFYHTPRGGFLERHPLSR